MPRRRKSKERQGKNNIMDHLPQPGRTPLKLQTIDDIMKRTEARNASIVFRDNLMRSTARSNYMNEYDRIRGVLSHTIVGDPYLEHYVNRQRELRALMQANVYPEGHEIYRRDPIG